MITGDISDWRMVTVISATGMSAYIKNMEDPTVELERIFSERWEADDTLLLSRIEETVYDHPQVLDDFTADVVVMTPRTVWMPARDAEKDDEAPLRVYNSIYEAEEEDLFIDEDGELLNLYSLVPGLLPFLQRTFPGARVSNHLTMLSRRFRERMGDLPRLYIDIREGETDYILFDGREMQLGVTHPTYGEEDIRTQVSNILEVYGLKENGLEVSLSGERDIKTALARRLRERIGHVMLTMMPQPESSGMPLAAMLALRHQTTGMYAHLRVRGQEKGK